jgi:hypothetical protein
MVGCPVPYLEAVQERAERAAELEMGHEWIPEKGVLEVIS